MSVPIIEIVVVYTKREHDKLTLRIYAKLGHFEKGKKTVLYSKAVFSFFS